MIGGRGTGGELWRKTRREARWSVWLLAALSLLMLALPVVAGRAHAEPVLLTFDDITGGPDGSRSGFVLTDQYADRGVHFNGPRVMGFPEGPHFVRSEPNAIVHCFAMEFCDTPFQISFDRPVRSLRVRAGYDSPLARPVTILMVASDSAGSPVARDLQRFLPSPVPIPIGIELAVRTPEAVIREVEVRLRGGNDAPALLSAFALDDLEFEYAPPRPLPDLAIGGARVSAGPAAGGQSIEVLVQNEGKGNAPESRLLADLDGRRATTAVPAIGAGGALWIRVPFDPSPPPGMHRLDAVIDPQKRIRESNERNNERREPVTVRVPVPALLALDRAEAVRRLDRVGLVLGAVRIGPAGSFFSLQRGVLGQDPVAGTLVDPGTAVAIVVAPPVWARTAVGLLLVGAVSLVGIAVATRLGRGRRASHRDRRPPPSPAIEARPRPGAPPVAILGGVESPIGVVLEIAVRIAGGSRRDEVSGTERTPPQEIHESLEPMGGPT
ncbi:MAG: CARDB domain-containing protein [Candidatus Eisenbacteria bacterium]|nr:CARDB domain-containing protein [Candidatus Eisenbacteria bacterium]